MRRHVKEANFFPPTASSSRPTDSGQESLTVTREHSFQTGRLSPAVITLCIQEHHNSNFKGGLSKVQVCSSSFVSFGFSPQSVHLVKYNF